MLPINMLLLINQPCFFEAYGIKGWKAFEKTIDYINKNYPNHFIIADAKRGDIGNTSGRYAKAF